MKKIDENTFLVTGNLYTDMYMDPRLLDDPGISIHVRGDVLFGVLRPPNKLKSGDVYMRYEEFINTHGPIYDLIACSKI